MKNEEKQIDVFEDLKLLMWHADDGPSLKSFDQFSNEVLLEFLRTDDSAANYVIEFLKMKIRVFRTNEELVKSCEELKYKIIHRLIK